MLWQRELCSIVQKKTMVSYGFVTTFAVFFQFDHDSEKWNVFEKYFGVWEQISVNIFVYTLVKWRENTVLISQMCH